MENHTWDYSKVITEPTETTTGMLKKICKCGITMTEEIPVVSHTQHQYSGWLKDENAHWKECMIDDCNYGTDKVPHTFSNGQVIIAPTETSEGVIEYYCVCGSTKQETVPKLNHTIKTTKLNKKNVGKNAFKKAGSKNYKKLVVKVPKSKYKSYKSDLKKRGLSTKAKIKK